jgi:hypothetical protein
MTATDKIDKILEVLAAGKTVYIQTALRITKVTAKDVAKFAAINRPLFRADEKSMYISAGNRYDCIDFCKITVA